MPLRGEREVVFQRERSQPVLSRECVQVNAPRFFLGLARHISVMYANRDHGQRHAREHIPAACHSQIPVPIPILGKRLIEGTELRMEAPAIAYS
jgi:hypothetical protein